MEYVTTKEISKIWGVSNRRVNFLCNSGRIAGAYKNGLMWLIPENAKKPSDRRKKKIVLSSEKVSQLESYQKIYEDSLNKEYKKNNGIYYTPYELIDLMYSDIDISEDDIILDPCCGFGGFIIKAIENGLTNVYGVDNNKETVNEIVDLLKTDTIIHYDSINNSASNTLSELGIQNPDVIIGNPPYVPHGSIFGNLFVGSIIRSLDMLKDNGILSYIIPKNFLHISTYNELRKVILSEYQVVTIVDLGIYFKNVRGEQIVLTIKKSKPSSETLITFKKLEDRSFIVKNKIKQKLFTDVIRFFMSSEELNVYEKLSSTYQNLEDFCKGYIGRGRSKDKFAINGKDIRKFGFKNRTVPNLGNKIFIQNIYSAESGIIGSFAGDLEAKETVTVITDGSTEICLYLVGILHSRLINYYLYKYCFNCSKLTAHTDKKYISQIPIVISNDENFELLINYVKKLQTLYYMGPEWHSAFELLNDLVYKIYRLNATEKIFIENYMKNIQSARWNNYEK